MQKDHIWWKSSGCWWSNFLVVAILLISRQPFGGAIKYIMLLVVPFFITQCVRSGWLWWHLITNCVIWKKPRHRDHWACWFSFSTRNQPDFHQARVESLSHLVTCKPFLWHTGPHFNTGRVSLWKSRLGQDKLRPRSHNVVRRSRTLWADECVREPEREPEWTRVSQTQLKWPKMCES